MKNKKIDLWAFFQTLALIILGVWLGCTVRDSAKQEDRIEILERQNNSYLTQLEELREATKEANEDLAAAVGRIEDLETGAAETSGTISRIYYTLRKLTRQKAQEDQKEDQVAQIATETNQTATWSSDEATQASNEEPAAMDESSGSGDGPAGLTYIGIYNLTAYPWSGDPCADEVFPEEGYTAACNDPALWHKWVYIEGVGERYIHDTGDPSVMGSDTIDIFIYDSGSCYEFGRRQAGVYVIE